MSSTKNGAIWGTWSFIGTMVVLAIAATHLGGFEVLFRDLWKLLTFQFSALVNSTPVSLTIPLILAGIVVDVPLSIGAGVVQAMILGKPKGGHALEDVIPKSVRAFRSTITDMVGKRNGKALFGTLFTLTFAEELFARYLCLGVIGQWLFGGNNFALVLMFLVGNTLWALVHLSNYKLTGDRHPLRVAPQFVSGVMFTYIYLKFGFTASVFAHFGANAVLFSLQKLQKTDGKDVLITGYALGSAAVFYTLMGHSIRELAPWFVETPVFALPGWSLWNYVFLGAFVPSAFSALFGILAYDRHDLASDDVPSKKSSEVGGVAVPVILGSAALMLVLAMAMRLGMIYASYWALGFLIVGVQSRVLFMSALFNLSRKTSSPSAVARIFWTSLPSFFVTVCISYALGFWQAVLAFSCMALAVLPLLMIRKIDD